MHDPSPGDRPVPEQLTPEAMEALSRLPAGLFLMTAAFEDKRAGLIVRSVQQCADEPALIAVSARKGYAIAPLIRDSHAFVISQLTPEDRLAIRKFGPGRASFDPPDADHDPFESFDVRTMTTGAPVLARSPMALECEVVRHFDLESDHEFYVGAVIGGLVQRSS